MSTASATVTLPAITIVDCVGELVEGGSLSAGARISAVARLADEAMRRGLDPHAPIDVEVEVEVGQPLAAFIDGVMLGNSTAQVMEIERGRLRSVELTSSSPAWDRCRVTRVAY